MPAPAPLYKKGDKVKLVKPPEVKNVDDLITIAPLVVWRWTRDYEEMMSKDKEGVVENWGVAQCKTVYLQHGSVRFENIGTLSCCEAWVRPSSGTAPAAACKCSILAGCTCGVFAAEQAAKVAALVKRIQDGKLTVTQINRLQTAADEILSGG